MVDYIKIIKGEIFFFIGFIMMIVLDLIMPILIDVMNSIYPSDEITNIIWFGTMLIYILAGLILPLYYIYEGIITETSTNKFTNMLIGFFNVYI